MESRTRDWRGWKLKRVILKEKGKEIKIRRGKTKDQVKTTNPEKRREPIQIEKEDRTIERKSAQRMAGKESERDRGGEKKRGGKKRSNGAIE